MKALERQFGRTPEAEAEAPGRVNLIGEHTDYNYGFVLPLPLPQRTRVELAARDDGLVRVGSLTLIEGNALEEFTLGQEEARGTWVDYVQGVTRALAGHGIALPGFVAVFDSDLPIGAGLSSSAALSVALLRALRSRFQLALDDVTIARLAQQAEHELVGARVGIMDPLAISLGRPGQALFVDTRDLTSRHVEIPPEIEVLAVDSGTGHRHASGEYNRRREECERAASLLGVSSLREVGSSDLDRIERLPEPLNRRARHVVTENERVLAAVRALEDRNGEKLGVLLNASHESLRDDYQVSTPEIDRLVGLLRARPGVHGARITGGGFGGAVVGAARQGAGAEAASRAAAEFDPSGERAVVILPRVGAGAIDAASVTAPSHDGPNGDSARVFQSFFMGGFECSTHVLRSGRRLDMIAATRHDEFTARDYRYLMDEDMKVARDGIRWHVIEARPGEYDFSSARTMVRVARAEGIQVVWDLLHFGWPDHVDPFAEDFPTRFAEFALRFAHVLREEGDGVPAVAPVNEISFLSFAGGEVGFFNPFARRRGDELKRQLVRASILAGRAVRSVNPRTRLIHTDPIINVVSRPDRPEDVAAAEAHRQAQFHAWDMIAGRLHPELGGAPELLDVIGVNYYVHNQWYFPGGHGSMLSPATGNYRPVHELILDVHRRYGRPIFIAETGIEDEARPAWLSYIGHEARQAVRAGADLQGLCLYPVMNHPGWEDERHCHNGLWDYADARGERTVYGPMAEELRRQREALRSDVDLEAEDVEARRALASLDEIARSIAEKTEASRTG